MIGYRTGGKLRYSRDFGKALRQQDPKKTLECRNQRCRLKELMWRSKSPCKAFRAFCNDLGIRNKYSTSAYPQSNGQAEAVNKTILNGLKRRLDGVKGRWAEELPNVLWAYRTTPRRSTSETLFSLAYGAEAVIPTEVSLCSARVAGFDPAQNADLMMECLDWIEECREAATIRLAEYQQKLAQRYNQDVKGREFSAGELVLRKVVGNM